MLKTFCFPSAFVLALRLLLRSLGPPAPLSCESNSLKISAATDTALTLFRALSSQFRALDTKAPALPVPSARWHFGKDADEAARESIPSATENAAPQHDGRLREASEAGGALSASITNSTASRNISSQRQYSACIRGLRGGHRPLPRLERGASAAGEGRSQQRWLRRSGSGTHHPAPLGPTLPCTPARQALVEHTCFSSTQVIMQLT